MSARFVPIAALAMAGSLIILWLATSSFVAVGVESSVAAFLFARGSWIIIAGTAISGGVFIVPLYAILQTHSVHEIGVPSFRHIAEPGDRAMTRHDLASPCARATAIRATTPRVPPSILDLDEAMPCRTDDIVQSRRNVARPRQV